MVTGIYGRVSTVEQKKYGHSVDLQIKRLVNYCIENNFIDYKQYIDEGKSGSSIQKRPQMMMLLNDIKEGIINKIIAVKLDRLFRNLKEFLEFIKLINNKKCQLVCLDDNINTNTAQGRMYTNILMAMYEFERELAVQRTEEIQFELVNQGKLITKLPFGYKPIKRLIKDRMKVVKWEINEKDAETVKKIYYLKKTMTTQQIARVINLPYNTIKNILKNKAYCGIQTYKNIEYKCDLYEPIIMEEKNDVM